MPISKVTTGSITDSVAIDTDTLVVDGTNNRVGIKTVAPDLALHVEGTNAAPASSGSTPTGFVSLRQKDGGSSHGANIGVLGVPPWGTWIQGQDANNLATSYPLLLNPNGGNVGIGTSSPSTSHKLTLDHTSNYGGISLKQSGTQVGQIIQEGGTGNIYVDAGSAGTGGSLVLRTNSGSERMRIDSSGRVTTPYNPVFFAYRTSTSPTNSIVVFNSTYGLNVGSHYNTSNGKFTAPVAGSYLFTASTLANPVSITRINFRHNGNSRGAQARLDGGTFGGYVFGTIQVILSLAAADYVEVFGTTDNGSTDVYSDSTPFLSFGGHLIG